MTSSELGKYILRQYANSPRLRRWLEMVRQALDPTDDIEKFYSAIWNIDTATGYGLDVWGAIVGVGRWLTVTPNYVYLGFQEAQLSVTTTQDPQPFGQKPFYLHQEDTSTVKLSDKWYRKVILMKAMANITDCSIPDINALLVYMFGSSGRAYITDDGDMSMSYVFEFELSDEELAIIESSGALPHPAGVSVSYIQSTESTS